MDNLLAYMFTYRVESISAYINYDLTDPQIDLADNNTPLNLQTDFGNNNGTLEASEDISMKQYLAMQAFDETHSLSYFPPTLGYQAGIYMFHFEYTSPENPTDTSDYALQNVQETSIQPYQSETGRLEDYNDFASELAILEMPVTTSNELLAVVRAGAKPIFTLEDSSAELVYETAKDVLRDIIDDGMTDYEKMLAIYDWVSYNVVYDIYVYEESIAGVDMQDYKVFYLEGVFLDGLAVCDGIAKSISLLGNMEGIRTIKINGDIGSENSGSGHAWNKVYLDISGGGQQWYVIDATWGDIKAEDEFEINHEYLSRSYFLVQDSDIETTHFASSKFNPETIYHYDFYEHEQYYYGYDLVMDSVAEVEHLISYMDANMIEAMEVTQADGFSLQVAYDIAVGNVTFENVITYYTDALNGGGGHYIIMLNYE